MKTPSTSLTRRAFLASTAAGAALVLKPDLVFGAAANSKVRLGLIGCGGRGMWIADLFQQAGGYEWVAGADFFEDRVNTFGDKFGVPAGRRHTGLAAHRRLLEDPVDAVVIQTPPYFHPQQAMDAVEAGKHVFLSKPVAVDVPGCLTIGEAGRRATERRLVFLVDFQTRASVHYREALGMVRRGDIGDLVMVESYYPWRGGGRGAPPSSPAERLRSWYYVLELSGDFIVEQSIHALDVATWIVDADPIRAVGMGGRKVRPPGSIYDHFVLRYDFPGDLAMSFTCIQAIPEVRDEIRARAFGAEGVIDTDYYTGVVLRGKEAYRGDEPNLYTTGTEVNIREFHQFIAAGQCDNPTVGPSVRSNLTAVLGREAGYRRGEVTLAELLREDRRLEPDLSGLKI
jgi:myo-inositol 2-dehydrogenase / D-chiro-inositol 1-dehydrogenase